MTPKNSSNIQIIFTYIHNYYLWLTLLIELKRHTHMAEYRVCSVYFLNLGHNYWSQMLAADDASSGLHRVPISGLSLSLCINHIIGVNHGGHMLNISFLIKSIYEMIYWYISNMESSSCLWELLGRLKQMWHIWAIYCSEKQSLKQAHTPSPPLGYINEASPALCRWILSSVTQWNDEIHQTGICNTTATLG